MIRAVTLFWGSLVALYGDLFPLVGMNVLWFVFDLPLMALLLTATEPIEALRSVEARSLVASLLFFPPTPLAGGLHLFANRLAKEQRVEFGLFWQGLKQYFWRSLLFYSLSILAFLIIGVNIYFYASFDNPLMWLVAGLWILALILWYLMQFYLFPQIIEQPKRGLVPTYKNALLLTLDNFMLTLTCCFLVAVVAIISSVLTLPLIFFATALTALLENKAFVLMLEKYEVRDRRRGTV